MPRSERSRTGSSPLTRGKHALIERDDRGNGLIPAHAGKTAVPEPALNPGTAHPRSRGENPGPILRFGADSGSSPLTRGKRLEGLAVDRRLGLIPAHAGKTVASASSWGRQGAHPRSRGENAYANKLNKHGAGSSPLTRGKQ